MIRFKSIIRYSFQHTRMRSSIPQNRPHRIEDKHYHRKEAEELRRESRPEHQKSKEDLAQMELRKFLSNLHHSHHFSKKCQNLGISPSIFKTAAIKFRNDLLSKKIDFIDQKTIIKHHLLGENFDRTVIPYLFKYIQQNFKSNELKLFDDLVMLSELKNPGEAYPEARKMRRKIIMHVGPTNSGKTYHALQRFRNAESGIYCGPLRLLAHEVYEKSRADGIACNLLTGEERKESDGVNRWSSTVEMASTSRKFDVAVIDEIQMISDSQRGWAWTQAFYGIQAEEIHLCGEERSVELIKKLCISVGEEVEVKYYKRLTGLEIDPTSLEGNLKNVKAGDCLVAFSRAGIFKLKDMIEKSTNLKAAVIYGSLPPESRTEQAKLFNDPKSDLSVLVASDAIGMGLNLYPKYNGVDETLISVSQGKQIAGRAGRFGTQWENGLVTTFQKEAVPTLRQYLKASPGNIESAGLSPRLEHLENFSKILPNLPLGSLLERFEQLATVSGDYFLCNIQQQISVANMLDNVDMSFADKYIFLQAPVNIRDEVLAGMLLDFATSHGEGTVVNADRVNEIFRKFDEELARLEVFHRGIMLYLWLSNRFPETFHEADKLLVTKLELEDMINKKLVANIKERRKVVKLVDRVNSLKQLLPRSSQKNLTIKRKDRAEDEY